MLYSIAKQSHENVTKTQNHMKNTKKHVKIMQNVLLEITPVYKHLKTLFKMPSVPLL